jgi:RNA polymerase sigma-70 factor (ECF subfamily)
MLRRLIASERVDERDWEAAYAEFMPRVYRFFCYRVGDGPTAEDLTSAVFEKAWRSRDRYRRDLAAFSTWLYAIARNVAVDYFRRQRDQVSLDELGDSPAPDEAPFEDAVARRDDFARLITLLAALPDRDRDVLALKFGAELSHREIARTMGLSESHVAVIAHRALDIVRTQWPEQD